MRKLVLTIVVLVLVSTLVGCDSGKQKDAEADDSNLEGTTWLYSGASQSKESYTFMKGGTLKYSPVKLDKVFTNGTWVQDGDSIYMEMNNKHAEQEGIISGDSMSGKAWNKNGAKWDWTATKTKLD